MQPTVLLLRYSHVSLVRLPVSLNSATLHLRSAVAMSLELDTYDYIAFLSSFIMCRCSLVIGFHD